MGNVKIRYYVTRQHEGRPKWGYWAPCLARRSKKTGKIEPTLMAQLGFQLVDCGQDGPLAWSIAQSWNRKWDQALADYRAGKSPTAPKKIERVYPPNSIGEAFAKFRGTNAWLGAKQERTREDWWRGWAHIEPIFGDVDPRTVSFEDLDLWYGGDPKDANVKGLVELIGVREAHRAMKIWRAMWSQCLTTMKRADGERYVEGKDPSLGVRVKTPSSRTAFWLYDEARPLVKRAWREGYKGLAAALCVAWDTSLSPVDVRELTLPQLKGDAEGPFFDVERAKTGKAAIGTITRRTWRVVNAYIASLPFTLHPETPIFHTRGGAPGSKGGRPRPPAPYSKDQLGRDFRTIRELERKGDTRTVADFRRSGAIEVVAGDASDAALAGKLANSVDTNKQLRATYAPHTAAVVRLADAAREIGRDRLKKAKGGGQ